MLPTRTLCKLIAVELTIAFAAFAWAGTLEIPEQEIVAGASSTQLPQQHERHELREPEAEQTRLVTDRVAALPTNVHVEARARYPAATQHRIGALRGGDAEPTLVVEAKSAASELGIKNPERWLRSLVLGFPD